MKNKNILIYYPDTKNYNPTPPYESLMLIEALKDFSERIIFVDAAKDHFEIEKLVQDSEICIITTLIKYTSITINFQLKDGINFSKILKNYKVPVVWTGMAPILLNKSIEENCPDDILVKTTDEIFLKIFIENYTRNNKNIKEIYEDTLSDFIEDKNSFKKFGNYNFEKISVEKYIHNNTFNYLATTGCVNSCSFCSVPVIYKKKWTHNSIENIINHLRFLFENFPEIKVIHFRDDNFLVSKRFIFDLFKEIEKQNFSFTWSCQTSVNILKLYTQEDLKFLYDHGCRNISIGIESGDDYILKNITKSKTTKRDSINTLKKIKNSGITVSVTSIISFPYNNKRDFIKTLKFLMRLKLKFPSLSLYCTIYQPIPGTEIFNEIYRDINTSTDTFSNNIWTTKKEKLKLKKFETFYFIFDNPHFYKLLPDDLAKDLKFINLFFSPLIRLRFLLGITSNLWEYSLVRSKLNKIKQKHGIDLNYSLSDIGIRHLTSNFNYGFNKS